VNVEDLSAIIHGFWMDFAKGIYESEVGLSKERKERWSKLFVPYSELSEEMKEKDRVFARRLINEYCCKCKGDSKCGF
jgi:hypothetical protein